MNAFKTLFGEDHTKVRLSLLWLFSMLNYIYADILTVMDASVLSELVAISVSGGPEITPTFLLIGAILMEIPLAMVTLSLMLVPGANRWANIDRGRDQDGCRGCDRLRRHPGALLPVVRHHRSRHDALHHLAGLDLAGRPLEVRSPSSWAAGPPVRFKARPRPCTAIRERACRDAASPRPAT